MHPSLDPKKVHNRMVSVNLSDLFYTYPKNHTKVCAFIPTREEKIQALEKDAAEMITEYGLEDQILSMQISLNQIAKDYLDRS